MSGMGLGDLTPEELAELEAYVASMETDPLRRAVNDYGQGPDFLGLSSEPTEWKRMGDKNDLLTDFFRTTKTYLPDWIPDMYPEVEDPGQFEGYISDKADLYRNNPAYTQLEAAMAEGATFEEAVDLIASDPEFAPFLPKTDSGRPDRIGFRGSAESYISERAREGREFDAYDAERQAYEDYVNPRTGEYYNPNLMDRETFYATQLKPETSFGQGRGTPNELGIGFGLSASGSRAGNTVSPLSSARQVTGSGRSSLNIDSPDYDGLGRDPRTLIRHSPAPQRSSGGSGYSKSAGSFAKKKSSGSAPAPGNMAKAYNKTASSVYERAQQIKASQKYASKEQENLAKLAAYYNAIHYGQ